MNNIFTVFLFPCSILILILILYVNINIKIKNCGYIIHNLWNVHGYIVLRARFVHTEAPISGFHLKTHSLSGISLLLSSSTWFDQRET